MAALLMTCNGAELFIELSEEAAFFINHFT